MIRLSRLGAMVAALVAVGCAQNGVGNGGTGGVGTGGSATGGSATGGKTGAGGGGGGASTCPADAPTNGDACIGDLDCSYGSQTCCGVTYATQTAFCLNGKFNVAPLETPCQLGGCPDGSAGGAGGGGGSNCPATPPSEGFSCSPSDPVLGCTYGSATCCGLTYPTVKLTCQQDSIVHQAVQNPCTADGGYVCPTRDGSAGGG